MAVVWSITPKAITPKGSGGLYVTIADYSVSGGTIPKTGGSFAFYNKPGWMKDISVSRVTDTSGYISAIISANVSSLSRSANITFEYEYAAGGTITSNASFVQNTPEADPDYGFLSYPRNINIPEGCTYSVSVTSGDVYQKEIYIGKPFIDSGISSVSIILNDIAKQFVSTQINDTGYSVDEPEYGYTNFVWCDVKVWDESKGESKELPRYRYIVIFNNDWSYDSERVSFYSTYAKTYTADPKTGLIILNDPINGHASPLQQFTFNVWSESKDANDKYVIESNGVALTSQHPSVPDNFSPNVKIIVDPVDVTNNISIKKSNSPDKVSYTTGYCGDYVLYYLNSYGGYDSFLIETNLRESRTIDQTAFGLQTKLPIFESTDRKSSVANAITTKFDFNSGWLTDGESDRFYRHLLSSPEVYLVELKTKKWHVVNISNLSSERKCFKNGRRLVSYDVSLTGVILTERR